MMVLLPWYSFGIVKESKRLYANANRSPNPAKQPQTIQSRVKGD